MTINTLPATFEGVPIEIVTIGEERWMRGGQIGPSLGYASDREFRKLFSRNTAEFNDSDTMVVELKDRLGRGQLTRLFSHKGVAKLAMLANTSRASAFRDWAAQVLTTQRQPEPEPELVLDAPLPPLPAPDLRDEVIRLQREMIELLRERRGGPVGVAQPMGVSRVWTPDEKARALALSRSGLSARKVGEQLGRSADSVRNKLQAMAQEAARA